MSTAATRNSLGIFWNGEESGGISAYGFWPRDIERGPAFPAEVWPPDTEWKETRLWGESWTVWLWDIRIRSWPKIDSWSITVENTLDVLLGAGAIVAWCGVEGCFVDPPDLFDPSEMAEGVWACASRGGVRQRPSPLEGRLEYLSKTQLSALHIEVTESLSKAH
jgi:hypothetical protein